MVPTMLSQRAMFRKTTVSQVDNAGTDLKRQVARRLLPKNWGQPKRLFDTGEEENATRSAAASRFPWTAMPFVSVPGTEAVPDGRTFPHGNPDPKCGSYLPPSSEDSFCSGSLVRVRVPSLLPPPSPRLFFIFFSGFFWSISRRDFGVRSHTKETLSCSSSYVRFTRLLSASPKRMGLVQFADLSSPCFMNLGEPRMTLMLYHG